MVHKQTFRRIAHALVLASTFSFALSACSAGTTVSVPPASRSGGSAGSPTAGPTTAPTPGTTATPTPIPTGTGTGGGTAPNVEPTIPFPSATDADPFYAQPKPFPSVAPGTILGSRKVTYSPGGVAQSNDAYELRFASSDVYGFPIAAVALYVKPLEPATGKAPLLVNGLAEDSLGASCAPSHYLTTTTPGDTGLDELPVATAGLEEGWTVDFPDHEGPFSEYAVGQVAGRVSLDSIRAAESFAPLGLNARTPVGLSGYSGGAIAVAWAAALQQSYAPALNIVGASSGGTPADILGVFNNINGTSPLGVVANKEVFAAIFGATLGINRGYPQFLTPLLNAKGVTTAQAMANGCDGATTNGSAAPTGTSYDYMTTSDPQANPAFVRNAEADSLPNPGKVPTSNYFIYQSQTDELIPIAGVDALVQSWCASGAPINYFRVPTGTHLTTEPTVAPYVLAYLTAKFNGTAPMLPPTTTSCNGAGGA